MGIFHRTPSIEKAGGLKGFTDHHSHILFGVDDGIQTLDDSLAVLDHYASLGVSAVWCTPHVMEDVPNTPEELRERFAELCAAWNGPVTLHLASEHMMDSLFEERLAERNVLPIGAIGNHLLVETSYFNPPYDLWGVLQRVKSAGYYPVLAHPERYMYMTNHDYQRLREMSVRFQLNLASLAGVYGVPAMKKARWLLSHGYYSLAGSDLHRTSMVDTILTVPAEKDLLPILSASL